MIAADHGSWLLDGPDWSRRRIYLTGPRRGSSLAEARKSWRELFPGEPFRPGHPGGRS